MASAKFMRLLKSCCKSTPVQKSLKQQSRTMVTVQVRISGLISNTL